MQRIDLILLGYYVIEIEKEDIVRAADVFLKEEVSVKLNSNGRAVFPMRDIGRIEKILEGKVKYKKSRARGVLGALKNNSSRIGFFLGTICVSVLLLFSSDVVWDVRIDGAQTQEVEQEILSCLSNSGLSVGKRWSKIDRSAVEIDFLSESKDVSWININRRGTVAYVKVESKEVAPKDEESKGYASIVASRDCVIEEITVEKGVALVKKGESVRAGQVLISGVLPSEVGGGFCYASGEVIGRYSDNISVSVKSVKENIVYGEEELFERQLKLFGISVNIFKNYRQEQNKYDIIIKTKDVYLFKRLPISFVSADRRQYTVGEVILTEEQMAEQASLQLREKLSEFLSDKEPQRLQTTGNFVDDEYFLNCQALVSGNVSRIKEFQVDSE